MYGFFLSLNSTMSYDFKYTPFSCIYQKSISSKNEQARYERLIEISDQRVSASVSQWVSVLSLWVCARTGKKEVAQWFYNTKPQSGSARWSANEFITFKLCMSLAASLIAYSIINLEPVLSRFHSDIINDQ